MNPVNLKDSREISNLKSKEVAELLNVKKSTISGYENGYDTIPILKLIIYSNYTKFSLDFLFGLTKLKYRGTDIVVDGKIIGNNLKKLRTEGNYTQSALAKKLHISQPSYSKYENGLSIMPTDHIFALTKIFPNISIDDIFLEK